ncbi:hypothetical protein ENBRE01_3505, partial [Enteropsectra breve]
TFQMAIMRTEEAINSLYNRSIKQIPYEVAKQKDKWTGEDKEIIEAQVNTAILESQDLGEQLQRIPQEMVGKDVWLKQMILNKMSPRWLGPYKVLAVDTQGNTAIIDMKTKEVRVNAKRTRSY